jgi:hypothetical protein
MKIKTKEVETPFKPIKIVLQTKGEAAIMMALIGPTAECERVDLANDAGHKATERDSQAFHALYDEICDQLNDKAFE